MHTATTPRSHRDDTTVTSRDDDSIAAAVKRAVGISSPALTLIWSDEEPERVGESIVLEGARPWVIGREGNGPLLAPRTPGRAVVGKPLAGDSVSRRQNAFLVGERASEQRLQLPYPAGHVFGEADALGMVGESPAMWTLRERLAAAADAHTHVLVLGETGVGKELAARAIHALGERADKKFLQRNASTLGEGVFDAEVFGCAKDFPNAGSPERKGLVGEAEGGTLMLDEIGTISKALQAKLLTFLDAGSYFRVGDERVRHADVLVIAATNVSAGDLKSDLGPRFKMKVQLPSLAARREDIPLLARHLVLEIAKTSESAGRFTTEVTGRRDVRMSCALVTWLVQRDYKGNTRELEEVLREAMLASPGDTIELTVDPHTTRVATIEEETDALSELAVRQALTKSGGNQTGAGRILGVDRHAVRRLMIKLGIEPSR